MAHGGAMTTSRLIALAPALAGAALAVAGCGADEEDQSERLEAALRGSAVAALSAPDGLEGRYARVIDDLDAAVAGRRGGGPPPLPAGRYVMRIDGERMVVTPPGGREVAMAFEVQPRGVLRAATGDACTGSQRAVYRFNAFGGTLALKAVDDDCSGRAGVMTGLWRKGV
jgi:hypothetical protein